MIAVGNQTSCWAAPFTAPFHFALEQGFDAFEWFPDKKPSAGWDDADLDPATRQSLRESAHARHLRISLHARWQANPLDPASRELFNRDLALARDLGAALFNIHLRHEEGLAAFVDALQPLLHQTAEAQLLLTIENTPHHSPEQFNELFARLHDRSPYPHVGLCLDLGHANLCAATRNDYLAFLDRLQPHVPILHLHLHENWGDTDSHLPLFTGPSAHDDSGLRGLLLRLHQRHYSGSAILEQWPSPPSLLTTARHRLLQLFTPTPAPPPHAGCTPPSAARNPQSNPPPKSEIRNPQSAIRNPQSAIPSPPGFLTPLVSGNAATRSWREKLDLVHSLLANHAESLTQEHLADLAIYLRFLSAGQISCTEDGRHFRPAHHARLSEQIQRRLAHLASAEHSFLLRIILPSLPSSAPAYQRPEPLTRIRDIAHRNDLPPDLKREIKTTLQNKLHRCAGPEDLATSAALLQRITHPDAHLSPDFVAQFQIFHQELAEFFNAHSLDQRLLALLPELPPDDANLARDFLAHRAHAEPAGLALTLERLTSLRQHLLPHYAIPTPPSANQELLLADLALEDHAFVLLGDLLSRTESDPNPLQSPPLLHALTLAVINLQLSHLDPGEAQAIANELNAWLPRLDPADPDQLLRLKATLERALRLAEFHSQRVLALLAPRAQQLGNALGVAEPAIRVFAESEVRRHLVFHLSNLASTLLRHLRSSLALPPWNVLVPGRIVGRVRWAEHLDQSPTHPPEPTLLLLQQAEGDEELPASIVGLVLAHDLPHLSHLAVRARQSGVVLVTCEDPAAFGELQSLSGQTLTLTATHNGVSWHPAIHPTPAANQPPSTPPTPIPAVAPAGLAPVQLTSTSHCLPIEDALPDLAGAKAGGARRLLALSRKPNADFLAPPGVALPFATFYHALQSIPSLHATYLDLRQQLPSLQGPAWQTALASLRDLVHQLPITPSLLHSITHALQPHSRFIVRSSANAEDLPELAGAGLYDSVPNVALDQLAQAIRTVWASLWSERAALSRQQSHLPHDQAHMAVLIQPLLPADLSFVIHTQHPITHNPTHAYAEIAPGLGETLVSGARRGSPYRLTCPKNGGEVATLAFANFSHALRPHPQHGLLPQTVDYSRESLSLEPTARHALGQRLGLLAHRIEAAIGQPQDLEGLLIGPDLYLVQARPQLGLPLPRTHVPNPKPQTPSQKSEIISQKSTILALFEKRIEGDDALLELARHRLRQAGLGIEIHGGSATHLAHLLRFQPAPDALVVVHLPRDFHLLRPETPTRLLELAHTFQNRILGFVLHDHPDLTARAADYLQAARDLNARLTQFRPAPKVFIEYAVGLEPAVFASFFATIRDLQHLSACLDTGHVGLWQVRHAYAQLHPGEDIGILKSSADRLPDRLPSVQAAIATALPAVLDLIDRLAALGKHVHFHLHDGHPLSTASPFGVSDHLSFLTTIPLPTPLPPPKPTHAFTTQEPRPLHPSLPPIYGPEGLRQIVARSLAALGPRRASFTLEIHPTFEQLPLDDGARFFAHWRDRTNAEQMNHWLDVLAQNHALLRQALTP